MNGKNESERFLSGKELYQSVIGKGSRDVHALVGQLLIELGFKSKLIGTTFLKNAILYRYEKSDVAHVCYTNEVYAAVADKLHSTPTRVERAIRTTISDCCEYGNLDAFGDLTHSRVATPGYAPSNTELISNIVSWLQLEKDKGHIRDSARQSE